MDHIGINPIVDDKKIASHQLQWNVLLAGTGFISSSNTGIVDNMGAPIHMSLVIILVILAVSECKNERGEDGDDFLPGNKLSL